MHIADALGHAIQQLSGQLDCAKLDAEILLAHTLGKPRSYVLAWPERALAEVQLGSYCQLIEQRKQGMPVAYLLGQQEFWSIKLSVGPGVLVPRPDTELLVQQSLSLDLPETARVVDLGTGSGAIALALASERPNWNIDATDINAAALKYARRNQQQLNLQNVTIIESNWCSELGSGSYDLIISNPPYIADNDPHLVRGGLQHEPQEALAAGEKGMDDLLEIIPQASNALRKGGYLLLEHGYDQRQSVSEALLSGGWEAVESLRDLAGHWRVTQARRPQ